MQPAVPSWQPAFYPIILSPTNHARHLPVFGPKLQHYPDGPFSCLAKSGCLSRGRATWIALPPQCSVTSLLPWALTATSSYQRISGVFLSQFHEFGVEVFYFKTIHSCFYAFQGFIRAFRDNRCFLAFQHCFRFLKNLQLFLELWSLSISTSVWRIPCL